MSNSTTRRKSIKNGVEILVRGTVQGVGFRPFVFKLASRFSIFGTVTNTSEGVVIRAAGPQVFSFIDALSDEAPPLARIDELSYRHLEKPMLEKSFTIIASQTTNSSRANIPPDISVCEDCFAELTDPADRRFGYPFINCTNCGPRFSIIETIPYDRPKTSMKLFDMCDDCSREYLDPLDRRFHAQPNACPLCGPTIYLHDTRGQRLECEDVIEYAISAITSGKVLALRGLGGFHLCVDGCSESGVDRLRKRKNRPDKPLAIMVKDLDQAETLCDLSDREKMSLTSPQHPIVLLRPKPHSPLAVNLAPKMSDIGLMLPYTPLHHLLFAHPECPAALVMTSGNISGEPICTSNEEALSRLAGIADLFVLHNRDIVTRVDDSVVKLLAGDIRSLRRARGYAPEPVQISQELPELIGCGGGLKSTFSLARGTSIYPSQHIGDLFNTASLGFYTESVDNLKRLYEIEPVAAACDLHPDYLSSHYAKDLDLPLYRIQHHHAHAAAVMAEHNLEGPVLAVVLDGTGYGTDGTIWGGEVLQADLKSFTRLGHLEQLCLPGGDAATEEPWRMGMSLLHRLFGEDGGRMDYFSSIDPTARNVLVQMLENRFNTPLTSSCGRLFDGVAALLGLTPVATFEGQAAMQLEALARQSLTTEWKDILIDEIEDADRYLIKAKEQRWEIISSKFVKQGLDDISSGKDPSAVALQFHSWLISCISRLVEKLSGTTEIRDVVLSGGSMQNGILLEGLLFALTRRGLTPHTGTCIPINDGGVSVGQALIGGMQHVSRSTHES
ncbi:MAG: carbamoyltransferase HypF [Desulfofustis sp.]|nr:carbamoyltransferase HypF [Desulfofustis sp.]